MQLRITELKLFQIKIMCYIYFATIHLCQCLSCILFYLLIKICSKLFCLWFCNCICIIQGLYFAHGTVTKIIDKPVYMTADHIISVTVTTENTKHFHPVITFIIVTYFIFTKLYYMIKSKRMRRFHFYIWHTCSRKFLFCFQLYTPVKCEV